MLRVKDVMTKKVDFVSENSTVAEAAQKMNNLNVGSMPVCNDGGMVSGIVTDRDIVLRNVSKGDTPNNTITSVMSKGVVSVTPETDVHDAAKLMAENQVRRLPVVENNKIVGIVSIGDLAVRDIYVNEAGDALSSISEPSRPMM
ncbi:CBS domain-containing protein [Clostridiisalibacter paucivorans]|uniref:CBS domain-containing protein n=1 Tax=Clostridiisalibacter paucivorans TaxID=408753 RepID=UPI00055085C0|nr:CBS domain-containing protein [Clostridiisalibacter paucivorans]